MAPVSEYDLGAMPSEAKALLLPRLEVLAKNPNDIEANIRVGLFLAEFGEPSLAHRFLSAGLAKKHEKKKHQNVDLTTIIDLLNKAGETQSSYKTHCSSELDSELERIVTLRQAGWYKSALQESKKLTVRHPRDAEVLAEQARACILVGELEAAETYLKVASEYGHISRELTCVSVRLLLLKKQTVEAHKLALTLSEDNPDDGESHALLGVCYRALGKTRSAIASFDQAIVCEQDYAEAFLNRGLAMRDLGEVEKACEDLEHAFRLKPHLKAGWNALLELKSQTGQTADMIPILQRVMQTEPNNTTAARSLAICYHGTGESGKAEALLRDVLAIEPDLPDLQVTLAQILADSGDHFAALTILIQLLKKEAGHKDALTVLASFLRSIRFSKHMPELETILLENLQKGLPLTLKELSPSILSLIKQNNEIGLVFENASEIANSAALTEKAAKAFSGSPILLKLMALTSIPDQQFETVLTLLRRSLLEHIFVLEQTDALCDVQQALALHCFTNEFIFSCTPDESLRLEALEEKVGKDIAQGKQPAPPFILCLASYKPLSVYNWQSEISQSRQLSGVLQRQVYEPAEEDRLKLGINRLKPITDQISADVRGQYEQNPYPRWVVPQLYRKPQNMDEIARGARLRIPLARPANAPLKVLVAGCGTGQHAIAAASRYKGAEILAIDLSLASLAYSKRKSIELGFDNIKYMQADILDLDELGDDFDVIESVGVLHHMSDPAKGWGILRNRLRSGGLMKVGLYSKLARAPINQLRQEIKQRQSDASPSAIRALREDIQTTTGPGTDWLSNTADFYALSETRDLLFHVQEHQFTLPDIEKVLSDLELSFCGFEAPDLLRDFSRLYTNHASLYDLQTWHSYEQSNPQSFAGMYQFWCQKTVNF